MRPFKIAFGLVFGLAASANAETLVFIRHAEKPEAGLGQLSCQGLNRALALPGYFAKAFPRIDAFFAPDPGAPKPDRGVDYDYVRPLATIEPTAIARGMPVDAHIGFADIADLEKALQAPEYQDATIVVAWEHKIIDVVANDLLVAHGGELRAPPIWDDADFDGVYVLTLGPGSARLEKTREGLDGQSAACPS